MTNYENSRITNIKGKKFGRLTAIEFVEIDKFHRAIWKCMCSCGKECKVAYSSLKSGNTMSCGCIHDELFKKNRFRHDKHNLSNSRIFHIWTGMKQRCYNKNSPKFHRYGGRGISVCDEWLHDFQAFYDWSMDHGYDDDLTIDRINNDGNYEPSNCRWVTAKEQANNVSYNLIFEMNGKKQTLKQWSEDLGINYVTLYSRIYRNGWSFEKAISVKGDARYKDEGHEIF